MLMDTCRTMEEIYKREVWDTIDHVETLGLIDADKATELWVDQAKGMAWVNPKPEDPDTVYYCDICKREMLSEPFTDGWTHTCEDCTNRSKT